MNVRYNMELTELNRRLEMNFEEAFAKDEAETNGEIAIMGRILVLGFRKETIMIQYRSRIAIRALLDIRDTESGVHYDEYAVR